MITKELLKQEIDCLDEHYLELIYNILQQFPHTADISTHKTDVCFTNLSQDPVVGMWKDREEMRDSSAWVRTLRQTQWQNIDDNHTD